MRFQRLLRFLNHRISRFSSGLVIVLLIGAVSWALNACLSPSGKTGWLYLQPDTSTWTGFLLGIGMWVGAGALCLLLLELISKASDLLKTLAAMWRPIVVVAAAGYLLFFNDQGCELGLSLLGEHYGLSTAFLFLALFYWAANTWHTARLGIDRGLNNGVFGVPPSHASHLPTSQPPKARPGRRVVKGDERWLYWSPRLLGVFAHLFAAINLSWAAWKLPLGAWGDSDLPIAGFDVPRWALRWLAWSAPFAIAFATAFVWAEDSKRSTRSQRHASLLKLAIARWMSPAAIAGGLVVFAGLAYLGLYRNHVPEGFLPGTLSIFLSALAFLAFISWLRNLTPPIPAGASAEVRAADDAWQRRQIQAFTLVLFALAFLVAFLVWTVPAWFGTLGSMVIAYFAFGAILALVNAIELAIESVSGLAITKQWLGEWAAPRALGACVVVFAIVFGLLNAWLHPFHPVRLCDGGDCVSPDKRPRVADAAKAWYAQAKAAYKGDGPVPMLIVAAAGGGIRAAYWTATVLEKLEDDFAKQGGVRPYLFAISGVSGGSVGAMDFEAALARRDESQCGTSQEGDKKCPRATDFLKQDFLAPALASLVFQDAPSSFLPDFGQGDRGAALEKSFERASNDLLARPFLSFFRQNDPAPDQNKAPWWRPILLLNATHEETGNRIITGHVLIERNVFVDSLDALQMLGKDVRASTAAHNSARFTYVSPAGNLGSDQGSVIDGGYFENFGALSALELAHAATAALKDEAPKVKLVILMISSDPDLDGNHMLVRINEVRGIGGAEKSSENAKKKCLVSVAEREHASATNSNSAQPTGRSANYFTVDPTGIENALVNEFVAPFQGLEKVREAHGNWAAAELALEVCAEFTAAEAAPTKNLVVRDDFGRPFATRQVVSHATFEEPSQMQIAAVRDYSRDVSVDDTEPVDVKLSPDRPYFAHLAMCKDPKDNELAPIQPPLGWVLSKWTQDHFGDLLQTCGNEKQLPQLETALGGKPQQHPAEQPGERLGER